LGFWVLPFQGSLYSEMEARTVLEGGCCARSGDSNSNHAGCSPPKSSRSEPGPETVTWGVSVWSEASPLKEEGGSASTPTGLVVS